MYRHLILLIFLVGCCAQSQPRKLKYLKGDCYTDLNHGLEIWQKKSAIYYKILEIGKNNYRVVYGSSDQNFSLLIESTESFRMAQYNTEKVPCPKALEEY